MGPPAVSVLLVVVLAASLPAGSAMVRAEGSSVPNGDTTTITNVTSVDNQCSPLRQRQDLLDARLTERDARLTERDARLTERDARLTERDTRLTELHTQLNTLQTEVNSRYNRMENRLDGIETAMSVSVIIYI